MKSNESYYVATWTKKEKKAKEAFVIDQGLPNSVFTLDLEKSKFLRSILDQFIWEKEGVLIDQGISDSVLTLDLEKAKILHSMLAKVIWEEESKARNLRMERARD